MIKLEVKPLKRFKAIYVVLCLVFALAISGCANTNQIASVANNSVRSTTTIESDTGVLNPDIYQDLTNHATASYNSTDVENGVIAQTIGTVTDSLVSPDIQSMMDFSTLIVRGSIQNITYTFVGGIAWTEVDVLIEDVLYGERNPNDIITVYYLGGYVPVEDYVNYYGEAHFSDEHLNSMAFSTEFFEFVVEGEDHPNVSENNLYFLVETPENSPLPTGVYERVCNESSTFQVSPDGEYLYRNCTGAGEVYMTEVYAKMSENGSKEVYLYEDIRDFVASQK